MEQLVLKYARKLEAARLVEPGAPLVGGMDADLAWNRRDPLTPVLEEIMAGLSINSLLFSRPAEPFASIMDFLASRAQGTIQPEDCETRTFLHDLPVAPDLDPRAVVPLLKKRKCCIIPGQGVVAFGTVSPEQAFVTYSSVCFSTFVKFFYDYLWAISTHGVDPEFENTFARVRELLERTDATPASPPRLMRGPFTDPDQVQAAMIEAGRHTVEYGLVDSYFGNISCVHHGVLHISQTGSSLDELAGCIDPCPMDGSSSAGLTASSELSAHLEVVRRTRCATILHGHPRFSVILSMLCLQPHCEHRGRCHVACPCERFIGDVPVVPGEVGTGPFGLCHTLPPAMEGRRGVIVHGHGLFTTGACDFTDAFASLLDVETSCRNEYFRRVEAARSASRT